MSLAAYKRTQGTTETARGTEHRLLAEITGEMIQAQKANMAGPALAPVLHRNREMWSTFSADCAIKGNGLPPELRAALISISLWVDRFTSDVIMGRDTVDALITVNRNIMDGLKQG